MIIHSSFVSMIILCSKQNWKDFYGDVDIMVNKSRRKEAKPMAIFIIIFYEIFWFIK